MKMVRLPVPAGPRLGCCSLLLLLVCRRDEDNVPGRDCEDEMLLSGLVRWPAQTALLRICA